MRDIENELVVWGIEGAVEGDREFDDAEIGPDVAAVFSGDGDEFGADFLGELRQLGRGEGLHISRTAD